MSNSYKLVTADVGDALCMTITSARHLSILYSVSALLDWGADNASAAIDAYFRLTNPFKPSGHWFGDGDVFEYSAVKHFMISHFHMDHYGGLITAASDGDPGRFAFAPEFVYFPELPRFRETSRLMLAMMTSWFRVTGERYGYYPPDIFWATQILGDANGGSNTVFIPISENMSIPMLDLICDVAWPPRVIDKDDTILTQIVSALEKYDKAKEQDPVLDEIEKQIEELPIIRFYNLLNEVDINNNNEHILEVSSVLREKVRSLNQKEWSATLREVCSGHVMPETTKAISKTFGVIANMLSVVMTISDWFLFMGDVGKSSNIYSRVINNLQLRNAGLKYEVAQIPHHGTYWNTQLYRLRINEGIVSSGTKHYQNYKREWKDITKAISCTYLDGDIHSGPKWFV